MEKINQILNDRESKHLEIIKFIDKYQVVTLKANIPGLNKNIKEAYTLLKYFDKKIKALKPNSFFLKEGSDGPMMIYLFSKEKHLKTIMTSFEENDSLGRFVDIDVFLDSFKSANRKNLRKCYLCENPAFLCGKMKTHTENELLNFLKITTKQNIKNMIESMCNDAMLEELNLTPKFGLITPVSNGSHKDMTYDLMIKSKDAIIPYLLEMFDVGYENSLDEIFIKIRQIGIYAENAMFKVTKGINTYKGLIFGLGLFVASLGYNLANNDQLSLFDAIKYMTKDLVNEVEKDQTTFGKIAFQKYQFEGARHEASGGFLNVQKIINKYDLETSEEKLKALCDLIINTNDTVLLKRCKDIKFYYEVKEKFKNLNFNKEKIDELNEWCIKHNLTFGGSADLLVLCFFLKKVTKTFSLEL